MSPPVKQFLRQLLASGTDSVHVHQVRRVGFGNGFHFEGKGNMCYILLTGLNCFQQETSKEISSPGPAINENMHAKHFLPGPGKQELYEGSGVYISKVEIQNIHIEAGKRPTEMLNKLLGNFFDLRTLASQRENLDDKIVLACSGMSRQQNV